MAAVPLVCGAVLCVVVWVIRGFGVKEASFELEDLRRDLVNDVQTQTPDFYREEVEPCLDSWKAKYGNRVPARELHKLQAHINDNLARIEKERQETIDLLANEGKTVEVAVLRQSLENAISASESLDRDRWMKKIDLELNSLEARFGTSIPIREALAMKDRLKSSEG